MIPTIILNPLPKSDGSCQFKQGATTVLAAVNGPIEVKARDELPNEATVEVILKPGIGVGGTREKYLEQTLQKTLRSVILVDHHPRTLIQIVAQVIQSDDHASIPILLSPLLNCCFLALLAAAIPLSTTIYSAHVAVIPPAVSTANATLEFNPSKSLSLKSRSSHTLAFTKEGELLLVDSRDGGGDAAADGEVEEGSSLGWEWDEFEAVVGAAKEVCCVSGVEFIRSTFEADKSFVL